MLPCMRIVVTDMAVKNAKYPDMFTELQQLKDRYKIPEDWLWGHWHDNYLEAEVWEFYNPEEVLQKY